MCPRLGRECLRPARNCCGAVQYHIEDLVRGADSDVEEWTWIVDSTDVRGDEVRKGLFLMATLCHRLLLAHSLELLQINR